jgi:hypothetical protein
MDAFQLIQNFFTRMRCNFCSHRFSSEDIQLLRQEDGVYIVNVYCNHCRTQNGVAVVGVEMANLEHGQDAERQQRPHPELTEADLQRLTAFKPISSDDVLDAHTFFNELGHDWMKFIPSEMRGHCTALQTESPDE